MPLASVDGAQVTSISVADLAVAVTADGTVGGVVSAGGCDCAGGGSVFLSPPPPPPPHADSSTPSDANVANDIFRSMRFPLPVLVTSGAMNLKSASGSRRQTRRTRAASAATGGVASGEKRCRNRPATLP
jgi:hypothetical protein